MRRLTLVTTLGMCLMTLVACTSAGPSRVVGREAPQTIGGPPLRGVIEILPADEKPGILDNTLHTWVRVVDKK